MPESHQSPTDSFLISQSHPPVSMGSGAVNGNVIDMAGWMGCAFVIEVGAITGAGTLDARVTRDDNSGINSATNITNAALTQVAAAANNNVFVIDVRNPAERYLRLVLTQAANTVIAGATAIRYGRDGILPPTASAIQTVKVSES